MVEIMKHVARNSCRRVAISCQSPIAITPSIMEDHFSIEQSEKLKDDQTQGYRLKIERELAKICEDFFP